MVSASMCEGKATAQTRLFWAPERLLPIVKYSLFSPLKTTAIFTQTRETAAVATQGENTIGSFGDPKNKQEENYNLQVILTFYV